VIIRIITAAMSSEGYEEKGATTSAEPVGYGSYEDVKTTAWGRLKGKAALQVSESRMGGGKWSNSDLDPVLPEFRTWRTYNFVMYWISDAFAVSNWRIGASLIAIGLSWKLALVAVVIGNFMTALVVTFNVRFLDICCKNYHLIMVIGFDWRQATHPFHHPG
jgi:NCS1 family nucleobase:cation symporter-1